MLKLKIILILSAFILNSPVFAESVDNAISTEEIEVIKNLELLQNMDIIQDNDLGLFQEYSQVEQEKDEVKSDE